MLLSNQLKRIVYICHFGIFISTCTSIILICFIKAENHQQQFVWNETSREVGLGSVYDCGLKNMKTITTCSKTLDF